MRKSQASLPTARAKKSRYAFRGDRELLSNGARPPRNTMRFDAMSSDWESPEPASQDLGVLERAALGAWRTGDFDLVLSTLERLVRMNPYEPGYHALRSAALTALGRHGEALKAQERAGHESRSLAHPEELRAWQARLIELLRSSDPVFRAHYAQNAVGACLARGVTPVLIEESVAAHFQDPGIRVSAVRPS